MCVRMLGFCGLSRWGLTEHLGSSNRRASPLERGPVRHMTSLPRSCEVGGVLIAESAPQQGCRQPWGV